MNRKTNPDHKAKFSHGVHVNCSCGWSSVTFFGKGSRREAAGEWRGHRAKCESGAIAKAEGREFGHDVVAVWAEAV